MFASVESAPPSTKGRQGPEGGEQPVDAGVSAVAFVKCPLACGVINERHPAIPLAGGRAG